MNTGTVMETQFLFRYIIELRPLQSIDHVGQQYYQLLFPSRFIIRNNSYLVRYTWYPIWQYIELSNNWWWHNIYTPRCCVIRKEDR